MKKTGQPIALWKICVGIALTILGIIYFERIISVIGGLWGIMLPLVIGAVMAYVLNIILVKAERLYWPNSRNKWINKTRRPVCILISIGIIVIIIVLLLNVVIPELVSAFEVIGKSIPIYAEKVRLWALDHSDQLPAVEQWLESMKIDWPQLLKNAAAYVTSGLGGILNSTVVFVGVLGKGVVNFVLGAIFAVYILFSKEWLVRQSKRLLRVYFNEKVVQKVRHVVDVGHQTFRNFIIGQCTEAVILGCLCTLGMVLFRFPYAAMVGALVGATALLPIVGAYIGAGVGAFMILTEDPMKAIMFLIFILILQQLEGNIIYPKVVGSSIGLPGMWVLLAVVVGGGIGGIGGILMGVPALATVYKLLSQDVTYREVQLSQGQSVKKLSMGDGQNLKDHVSNAVNAGREAWKKTGETKHGDESHK